MSYSDTYFFAKNSGDRKFLQYIRHRLVNVHGEKPYVDYILTLDDMIHQWDVLVGTGQDAIESIDDYESEISELRSRVNELEDQVDDLEDNLKDREKENIEMKKSIEKIREEVESYE